MKTRMVTILGAGPVGTLLGILLRKRGYEVTIYERRPDMRKLAVRGGRSINLTISARGWKSLQQAGVKQEILGATIPVYGRCLHYNDGKTGYQPYSKNRDAIYSINRGELNKKLLTLAECNGVKIMFDHSCVQVDVPGNTVTLELKDKSKKTLQAHVLLGADGTFSALRKSYIDFFGPSVAEDKVLNYGYKELHIPPAKGSGWLLDKNSFHLWARKQSMLIAMPNNDGSLTGTLFMPYVGRDSFNELSNKENASSFFERSFPDLKEIMPELLKDFSSNPISSLITTYMNNWHYKGLSALIGDAAHSIVPFYGQGMNAGFEDCSVLIDLLDKMNDNWERVLPLYQQIRKPDTDAVAELALINFRELRERLSNPTFLERKKIELELSKFYPDQFVPIYQMVCFTDTSYSEALRCVYAQNELVEKIMLLGNFFTNTQNKNFMKQLDKWIDEYAGKQVAQTLSIADASLSSHSTLRATG